MKTFTLNRLYLLIILFFFSCQKEISTSSSNSNSPTSSFEAKINGKLISFKVNAATLVRSTADNQKRLDITGTSTDGSKRLTITIGDSPASGNAVNQKDYIINLFNPDDPNTPQDESLGNDDGFITYSTTLGNNSWITDVDAENGTMTVTSCNASSKTVTGTFNARDSSLTSGEITTITEGKFNNISYLVVN